MDEAAARGAGICGGNGNGGAGRDEPRAPTMIARAKPQKLVNGRSKMVSVAAETKALPKKAGLRHTAGQKSWPRSTLVSLLASLAIFLLFAKLCLLQDSLLMHSEFGRRPRAARGSQSRLTYGTVLWQRFNSVPVESEDVADLVATSPRFNVSDERLLQVVKLVKKYTEPFQTYPGVKGGFGSKNVWKLRTLRTAAVVTSLMQCCVHVRVVDGKVYFRYGHFLDVDYRLNRANDLVTFLQATVDAYQLKDLKVEFLFNTCDHPLTPTSSFPMDRANYFVWSNHVVDGYVDVLAPDFLDWGPEYMPSQKELDNQVPWQEKVAKVVFRGATTNYKIQASNWGSSTRLRLHAMSSAYPELLEARVSRWSHAEGMVWRMHRDGIELGSRMNFSERNGYKYEILADGGLGTTRLCGVLMTNRVVVRQSSPFYQFYDPLLKPGHHYIEVDHQWRNLVETVRFLQQHDAEMEKIVENAHNELGWICNPEGRMLSYAVLLVKYQGLIDNVTQIEAPAPQQMCKHGAVRKPVKHPQVLRPDCMRTEPNPVLEVPGCPTVCVYAGSQPSDWYWLTADELAGWGNKS